MKRIALILGAVLVAWGARGQEPGLADLASGADLIAVVRVEATDYLTVRDFPSEGSAILKVLIPYRGAQRGDLVTVEEKGLGAERCYYPESGPFEIEGRRFLVFLSKKGKGGSYAGRYPGCRMPVLVTADSGYALRYPVPGVSLPEDAIEEVTYSDPAAFLDAELLTFAEVEQLVESGDARWREKSDPLAPDPEQLVYTRGVPIARVRTLMFPETE